MSETEHSSMNSVTTGLSLATTTGFIVAAAIIFIILFVFVSLTCLRAKGYRVAHPVSGGNRTTVLAEHAAAPRRCGLEAAAVAALPSLAFRSGDNLIKECAVCLCELAEGEAARLLPACSHAFHLECIDMWFYFHSTCPLCRSPVAIGATKPAADHSGAESVPPADAQEAESPARSPASVLLSSLHVQASANGGRRISQEEGGSGTSSSSWVRRAEEAAVVIEIPRRSLVEGFHFQAQNSPLFSSRQLAEDEEEEEDEPVRSPLSSLRRFLRPRARAVMEQERSLGCTCLDPNPIPKTPTTP